MPSWLFGRKKAVSQTVSDSGIPAATKKSEVSPSYGASGRGRFDKYLAADAASVETAEKDVVKTSKKKLEKKKIRPYRVKFGCDMRPLLRKFDDELAEKIKKADKTDNPVSWAHGEKIRKQLKKKLKKVAQSSAKLDFVIRHRERETKIDDRRDLWIEGQLEYLDSKIAKINRQVQVMITDPEIPLSIKEELWRMLITLAVYYEQIHNILVKKGIRHHWIRINIRS